MNRSPDLATNNFLNVSLYNRNRPSSKMSSQSAVSASPAIIQMEQMHEIEEVDAEEVFSPVKKRA